MEKEIDFLDKLLGMNEEDIIELIEREGKEPKPVPIIRVIGKDDQV